MKTIEVKTRLPEDVHAKLKELAIQEGRSMNKQIIWILTHFDSVDIPALNRWVNRI